MQEQHHFMETVELRGLKYDAALQDKSSGFSIVLSSVLKSRVSADSQHNESAGLNVKAVQLLLILTFQIKNVFTASPITRHFVDCSIVAYG